MVSAVTVSNNSRHRSRPHYQEFVCGFGAANIEIFLTYPLNKLIFRQQLHGIILREAMLQLRVEGLAFLYRGLLPPLVQKTSSRALMFGVYDEFQRIAKCGPNLPCKAFAGAAAGAVEATLTPLERIQTLLQNQHYHAQLRNTWHAFTELRPYGLREYYRGLSGILPRNCTCNAIFFTVREPLKEMIPTFVGGRTIIGDFLTGAMLGAFLSTICFPVNVIKTRMQSNLGGEFTSLWRTGCTIYRERNCKISGLYRGVHINFSRSLIAWGIINGSYELIEKYVFYKVLANV